MRYKVSAFLAILVLLFAPLLVFSRAEEKAKQLREEEIRRHLQTYRMWEMTKALDLSEEQVAKIFPALNRIEKEKAKLNREFGAEIKELKELLDLDRYNLEELQEKLERLKELKIKIREKDEEIEKLLENNLTVEQQAKYIIFSIRFMRDIREKMNRARQLYRQEIMKRRRNE